MYLAGIDIGTSAAKTAVYDLYGNIAAECTQEYPLYQPRNGWAEQDPADWWNAVCYTLQKVTAEINASEIAGVGFSGQMHGLVMLDEKDRVIRPAILRNQCACRNRPSSADHCRAGSYRLHCFQNTLGTEA